MHTVPDWQSRFSALVAGNEEVVRPVTDWVALSQLEVDLYGGIIADMDPMHNDPDWEPGKQRWGGPIALGSQLVARLPEFLHEHGFPVRRQDVKFELVELPRVRFIAPLPIGHRIRDHVKVAEAVEEHGEGGSWRVRTQHTVEREGLERPFMFAELVTRYSEV